MGQQQSTSESSDDEQECPVCNNDDGLQAEINLLRKDRTGWQQRARHGKKKADHVCNEITRFVRDFGEPESELVEKLDIFTGLYCPPEDLPDKGFAWTGSIYKQADADYERKHWPQVFDRYTEQSIKDMFVAVDKRHKRRMHFYPRAGRTLVGRNLI